jgi:hypothetical protein
MGKTEQESRRNSNYDKKNNKQHCPVKITSKLCLPIVHVGKKILTVSFTGNAVISTL